MTFGFFLSKILLILHQNSFQMRKFFKILTVIFVASASIFAVSCKKKLDNQIVINTGIDFSINPNSIEYQELNVTGGWMYLTSHGDSYGIIVCRCQPDQFMAYDRKPFYNSSCPDNRLNVDFPYIVDDCNQQNYLILNGYNMNGDGTHVYWYITEYDGTILRIHN